MMKRNCKGNRKSTNKKLFFTNIVTYITNIAGTLTFNTSFTKTIGQYSKFSFGGLNAGKENSQLFLEKKAGEGEESGKGVSHKNSNTLASRIIASYRA